MVGDLSAYKKKRNLSRSGEPRPLYSSSLQSFYVIQLHNATGFFRVKNRPIFFDSKKEAMKYAATHKNHQVSFRRGAGLHRDIRIAKDHVLKSFITTKKHVDMPELDGPSVYWVQTEDHPMAYAKFSGVIPAGSYGAGKVKIETTGKVKISKWETDEMIFEFIDGKYPGVYTVKRKGDRPVFIVKRESK